MTDEPIDGRMDEPGRGTARAGALAVRALAFALLWLVLTGADTRNPPFAAAVVLAAALVSLRLVPPGAVRPSPRGWARFLPFFVLQSVRAGFDVARRAFRQPRVPDAGIVVYEPFIPEGPQRYVFAAALGLFPGSITVQLLDDDRIRVHVLDTTADTERQLRVLERRVADLFAGPATDGAPPAGPPDPMRSDADPLTDQF